MAGKERGNEREERNGRNGKRHSLQGLHEINVWLRPWCTVLFCFHQLVS